MQATAIPRNQSLDVLRGLSILTMVLSGSIAFGGVLPAWMYHAQVPPPLHKFDPTIPGISWVDLVFPFFLFSMGAAIPLALRKWEGNPMADLNIWWIALRRFLLLTWFALFTFHMRAWVIAELPATTDYLLSIAAFVLLFVALYRPQIAKYNMLWLGLRIAAYIMSGLLLYILPFNKGEGFIWDKSDIIIIVLGNMAFFGTIIWWYTRRLPWLRAGVLLFVMAIFLGAKEPGTWQHAFMEWSPIPWMYKFYYCKYLFIIIPGTFAGEWMMQHGGKKTGKQWQGSIAAIAAGIVIVNVILLFNRQLLINLAATVALCVLLFFLVKKEKNPLLHPMLLAGAFLLLLGLFFEGYEGGIKKDPSTYSYYFVTAGLAFFTLICLNTLSSQSWIKGLMNYIGANGRNPMVAYVAGSLLLTPLLHISGTITYHNMLNSNAWTGLLKGMLFTGIVSLITYIFTQKKWYWKT